MLCEDSEVFRLELRIVLETQPDIVVVAETSRLSDALEVLDPGKGAPVVIVREGLVGGAELPLLRDLSGRGAAVLVLAEPGKGADSYLVEFLRDGVRGYLPHSSAQRVVEAVRALARHEATVDSAAADEITRLTGTVTRPGYGERSLERLTERQQQVAKLVAEGLTNQEIANRLSLSLATVKSHIVASIRRLGVRTRTQLAILINRDNWPDEEKVVPPGRGGQSEDFYRHRASREHGQVLMVYASSAS
ncbi:response regulator transcription factor [Geodermatophilus obscurus]|uniref:response regulator transcription factor n=1 Tax=Geodermatophilus obscurus TaxID=1861 RepID=UPI001FCBE60C|nr:response regulator transcription factor [Geodermatophilus obscurus]